MTGLMALLFLAMLLTGMPIAFAMGISSVLAINLSGSPIPMVLLSQRIIGGINSFVLLAVPLFILAGGLMDTGGISVRLVNLSRALVGHIKGGLGMVVVVAEMFFSGISGSTVADVSAVSSMLLPAMRRSGYRPEYAVSIISAASAMGILIPPANVMVVIGGISSISVAALFAAGFIPAAVIAACILALLYWQALRYDLPAERQATLRELGAATRAALIPLGMPVIIFGGILGGVVTPTEAAVVAVLYALIAGGLIYRELTWRSIYKVLVDTGAATGMIMFLVGIATMFSFILAADRVPDAIGRLILGVSDQPWFFLLVAAVVFVITGALLEGIPAVVLLFPIFLPLATQVGVDPIHFAIVVVAAVGIGLFLPPIGVGLLVACGTGNVPVARTMAPMTPMLVALLLGLAIVVLVPGFTLLVPSLLFR